MKLFRTYFLNKAIKKAETSLYIGWQKVETITILYDAKEDADCTFISTLISELEKDGKKTDLLNFAAIKRPKENPAPNTYYNQDVDIFGQPKKRVLQKHHWQMDVLINWTTMQDSPNDFILAGAKCGLKIGVGKSLDCCDLVIKDQGENRQKVINEILKCLKMINHE
jgi:hypothetical protein